MRHAISLFAKGTNPFRCAKLRTESSTRRLRFICTSETKANSLIACRNKHLASSLRSYSQSAIRARVTRWIGFEADYSRTRSSDSNIRIITKSPL